MIRSEKDTTIWNHKNDYLREFISSFTSKNFQKLIRNSCDIGCLVVKNYDQSTAKIIPKQRKCADLEFKYIKYVEFIVREGALSLWLKCIMRKQQRIKTLSIFAFEMCYKEHVIISRSFFAYSIPAYIRHTHKHTHNRIQYPVVMYKIYTTISCSYMIRYSFAL